MEKTVKNRGMFGDAWHRLRKNRLAILGLAIMVLFILSAAFADVIAPYGYAQQNLDQIFLFPCKEHILGTDNLGRDIFSRIIYGARISLQIGFVSVGISVILGSILGCISGFYGGKVDTLIMRMVDVMMAIPSVLLAIVIASVLGTGMRNLMFAIGISSVPSFARIVRASILSIRDQEYIEAARLSGSSDARIILRHILPNILPNIIVQVTLSMGLAILNAASLSFLGLGVQAPQPEWGSMLAAGRGYMQQYWHLVVFPGIAIVLLVLALNMIGDGLRDALDPRMKR